MYYEEKVIDGVLCWRGSPDGEWSRKTTEQLTQMLIDTKRQLARYKRAIDTCEGGSLCACSANFHDD